MSTSVAIVGVEEVVEAVVTVARAVGDVFIESARVIEVGETMVGKNVGNIFLDAMYNQIYFLTFYYISDIQ